MPECFDETVLLKTKEILTNQQAEQQDLIACKNGKWLV
jgi:hypothetical protein